MFRAFKFGIINKVFIENFLKNIFRPALIPAICPCQFIDGIFLPLITCQRPLLIRILHPLHLPSIEKTIQLIKIFHNFKKN